MDGPSTKATELRGGCGISDAIDKQFLYANRAFDTKSLIETDKEASRFSQSVCKILIQSTTTSFVTLDVWMGESNMLLRVGAVAGLTGLMSIGMLYGAAAFAADIAAPAKPSVAAVDTPFFLVNNNSLSFSYLPKSTGPGAYSESPNGTIDGKTSKIDYTYTHFDVWAYGTNFLNIDLYNSGHNDPATGCASPNPGTCAGAVEVYGVERSTFGFNEIFNTNFFARGPLRDVSLEVGTDQNTKNIPLAPATHRYFVGPQFSFNLPYSGYLTVAPIYFKDFEHSSFAQAVGLPGGNQEYRSTFALEIGYSLPLGFLPENARYFTLSGFFGIYGPKGPVNSPLTGANAGNRTVTELFSEPVKLNFDAGAAFLHVKPHSLEMFVAWRYWTNKFGLEDGKDATCLTSTGLNNGSCAESTVHTGVTLRF